MRSSKKSKNSKGGVFEIFYKKGGSSKKGWNRFLLWTGSRKCLCFSHSRASIIQHFPFVNQPWCPRILLSIPWNLHFEIVFVGIAVASNDDDDANCLMDHDTRGRALIQKEGESDPSIHCGYYLGMTYSMDSAMW